MSTLLQDVRFGLRMLGKKPGFTAVAVITLALGIGATTAMFSVVNGVLLSPLPFPNPNRLAILHETSPTFPTGMSVSYPNFLDWQREQRSFTDLAIFRGDQFNLSGPSGAEVVKARMVSAGFFRILGVSPLLGHGFTTGDDHPGAARTAVLSYSFWQRRFGGSRDILGKTLTMDDKSYAIIGVLPKNFWPFFDPRDVYVPIGVYNRLWTNHRDSHPGTSVVGRLKPGVTLAQAQADMTNIARRLAVQYPKADAGQGITLASMPAYVFQDVRATLYLLLGAVCLVLLIACVNVANLLLSRSAAREKEMAIRAALGAARPRVMRQLLTESVLLALFGGAAGIALAVAGTRLLLKTVPGDLPRSTGVGLDLHVLLFVVAVSVVTGLLFGLAPAFSGSKSDLRGGLQEGSRGSTGGRHRLQNGLVVAETGLALVLLVGAGLTLQSILHLERVKPGFDTSGALVFDLSLPPARYQAAEPNRAFYRELTTRLQALPGVQAVGATSDMPMEGDSENDFLIEGRPKPQPQDMPMAMFYLTSPGYIKAMGISLIRGRFFTDQDSINAPLVVVIDDALAREFFPHEDPIGQHLIMPFKGVDQPREIVGIVHHINNFGPAGPKDWKVNGAFYMPVTQIPDPFYKLIGTVNLNIIVRTSVAPQSMIATVKRAVHGIDNGVAITDVHTISELVRTSIAAQRFMAVLFGVFAALALALASIGIYGVISYSVTQRTHEIGIRLALGALPRNLLLWVIRQGMMLALLGVAGGIIAAVFAVRLLNSSLYGVRSTDPVTFIAVSVILAFVALFACYIPARRATKVDPIVALRCE